MQGGGSILGHAVKRREDPALVTGRGTYIGDMNPPGMLHAVFVRSPIPHGMVSRIDTVQALDVPGVVAVFGPDDLELNPLTPWNVDAAFSRPPLARHARYVGDPIAVVIAESEARAVDAAALVWPSFEELESVIDPFEAMGPNAPLLFPDYDTNVALSEGLNTDTDPTDHGEIVVRHRLVNQRLAPVPMEPAAALVVPGPDGRMTAWIGTQDPFGARADLAATLGRDPESIRVVVPAIGGGFGAKGDLYPEHAVVAAAASALARPVRWLERRGENFVNMVHGRNQVQDIALAADRDGRITGLSVDIVADVGAYPGVATWLPRYTVEMASGTYRIPEIRVQFTSVATNTTPAGPYRGAGRPEATQMIERMMDLLAGEVDLDPVELRRRNLIPRFEEPHITASGAIYDSGDYEAALEALLATAEYGTWMAERDRRRRAGSSHPIGVGVSTYVEVTVGKTPDHDHATVRVLSDGIIEARCGGSSHGQGHQTAFAMIVADRFDVPVERVDVIQSDTDLVPRGGGTYASRTLQLAGSSLLLASDDVIEDARRAAADELEAAPQDLVVLPGVGLGVVGDPGSLITWGEIAMLIESGGDELSRSRDERQGASTYPFGAHLAVVEVDVDTGWCRLVTHVAVDDCGTIINPMLVKGQQHGGIAQGAGQALFEHMRFDSSGFPLTANMASYSIPAATDLPSFVVSNTTTPTRLNPLGAKGVGEAGTLGSTPAIHSAVIDALASFGVKHIDMPLTPHAIWRAIHDQ